MDWQITHDLGIADPGQRRKGRMIRTSHYEGGKLVRFSWWGESE